MKRYSCYYKDDFGSVIPAMSEEDDNGEWADFEEAAQEIAALRNDLTACQLQRDMAYRTLRGISSCSTCEVCRGAALRALPQEAKHER